MATNLFISHVIAGRASSRQNCSHGLLPCEREREMEEDKHSPVPQTNRLQLRGETEVEEGEGGGVDVGVVERMEDTPQVPAAK